MRRAVALAIVLLLLIPTAVAAAGEAIRRFLSE